MIIVGTAGHIDHGKTTLVQALTGIDTDRLKEEKQRGISIELGFAPLNLPDGRRVGLVDVPGHERFVHHMIAGASGVDLVLMVIAADEGVMPQTREHLAICTLLGVRRGLVVLTKADLVDEEWLELVREDLRDVLADTFLSDAPILAFGAGWEDRREAFSAELLATLMDLAPDAPRPGGDRPFLLPIDRVFSVKGFGTVVTGTVVSGAVSVGDALEVLPAQLPVKVRNLEIHNTKATCSEVGTRTAVNLADADVSRVSRGMVLARPGAVTPTRRLVMRLETVPNLAEPVKARFSALFHVGTTYVEAEVRLLGKDRLGPGETALAALHTRQPVVILPGMHAVLRAFAEVADFGKTLGGGRILLPVVPRAQPENIAAIGGLSAAEPVARVVAAAFLAGPAGIRRAVLSAWVDLDPAPLAAAVEAGHTDLVILSLGEGGRAAAEDVLLHRDHERRLLARARARVEAYHAANPRRPAMPREELRSQVHGIEDPRFFHALCDRWVATTDLEGKDADLRLPGFQVRLSVAFVDLMDAVEAQLAAAALTPPILAELRATFPGGDLGDAVEHLVGDGRLVRVTSDLLFHRDAVDGLRDRVVAHLKAHGTITTQQYKEISGLTRKYLIPLAEYFDAARLTVRTSGSARRLRRA